MVVEGIWFEQIDDIEAISSASNCITYSEVVPLCESASVVVRLEN